MPKHKQSSSSDSDSGPEDRNPPPKKRAPEKSAPSAPKEDEQGWHIGNNRFAKVREFRGKIMVDIREFYEKNGELLPGKKGISLSAKQWKSLKEIVEDIDKKVSEMA